MDPLRHKKSDKARKNFEKTGGKSSKHVRQCLSLQLRSKQAIQKGKNFY